MAKALGWLLLHLVVLALAFVGFVSWQLGLGLDSLLSGSSGDQLREFGEIVRERTSGLSPAERDKVLKELADERKISAMIYEVGSFSSRSNSVPENVLRRIESVMPPPPPRPPGRVRPRPFGAPPPPPREEHHRDRERFLEEPTMDFPFHPELEEPSFGQRPTNGGARSRPLFLMRGAGGNGYWAGVLLHVSGDYGAPHPALLLIRSDRLDGAGMFFDLVPWLWGGLAVLGLSVMFWVPFFLSITRYLRRLTHAADLIASGQFQISLPRRSEDELGVLGQAIKSMAARLDHLVSGQKRFLGDAAHELCGPIARLRIGLGILEMKLPPEERGGLASIEVEAEELAALVEEILSFSRAGGRKPQRKSIVVAQLAKGVVAREAPDSPVEIGIPHELMLETDPVLLARAMGNVVRNSVAHAGSGAKITIRACEVEDQIEITITDNGLGVPQKELARIFEPFYRPDRSRTRETGGTGLGLAIVRTAMGACGGKAEASIPAGGGLAVTLTLPKQPA